MSYQHQPKYERNMLVGTLENIQGFQIIEGLSAASVFPDILSDMKGYSYTIAVLPFFPFGWKLGDSFMGVDIDIIKFLSRKYNFR